jgi:hypothetical protein
MHDPLSHSVLLALVMSWQFSSLVLDADAQLVFVLVTQDLLSLLM